jgi:uncharacterized OB-fold protein
MTVPLTNPDVNDERYEPYWDGFQQEELRLPQCQECSEFHWYPRPVCPVCGSTDISWVATSGQGRLYSWVGVQYDFDLPFFEGKLPWYTGLVQPEEDDSIHIVAALESPDDEFSIDMPLEIAFVYDEKFELKAPVFRPR